MANCGTDSTFSPDDFATMTVRLLDGQIVQDGVDKI